MVNLSITRVRSGYDHCTQRPKPTQEAIAASGRSPGVLRGKGDLPRVWAAVDMSGVEWKDRGMSLSRLKYAPVSYCPVSWLVVL